MRIVTAACIGRRADAFSLTTLSGCCHAIALYHGVVFMLRLFASLDFHRALLMALR